MGHKDVRVTKKYAHIMEDQRRGIASKMSDFINETLNCFGGAFDKTTDTGKIVDQ
jgi:hypothetical protein